MIRHEAGLVPADVEVGAKSAKYGTCDAGVGGGCGLHWVGSGGEVCGVAGLVDGEQTIAVIALQSMVAEFIFSSEAAGPMASITIRNLDDMVKQALRVQAARNGRSMEEEARMILGRGIVVPVSGKNLAERIRSRFGPLGGVDLEIPPREPMRERDIFADEA